MRTITLEEHFVSPGFLSGPGKQFIERWAKRAARTACGLTTASGGGRVGALRRWMPQVSTSRFSRSIRPAWSRRRWPSRSRWPARRTTSWPRRSRSTRRGLPVSPSLPIAAPDKAAEELERTIRQFGFKGTLINGHTRGRYLDDKFFWPILERADALNVPVYLHPTIPPKAGRRSVVQRVFAGGDGDAVGRRLGLAHRDGGAPDPDDPGRGVRQVSQASGRGRPPRRRHSVHAAADEPESAAGDDEARPPVRLVSARERPLHLWRI